MVSAVAGLDLSVAIRCFETANERIWFGAGGGIVSDSDPGLELAEAITKAAGPVAAIGGSSLNRNPGQDCVGAFLGLRIEPALLHGERPDPMLGVFSDALTESGKPLFLAEHLKRLIDSLHTVYGAELTRRRSPGKSSGPRQTVQRFASGYASRSHRPASSPSLRQVPAPPRLRARPHR